MLYAISNRISNTTRNLASTTASPLLDDATQKLEPRTLFAGCSRTTGKTSSKQITNRKILALLSASRKKYYQLKMKTKKTSAQLKTNLKRKNHQVNLETTTNTDERKGDGYPHSSIK